MSPTVARVHKIGQNLAIILPKEILEDIQFNARDRVALRVSGGKLIAERIPLENLARMPAPLTDAVGA